MSRAVRFAVLTLSLLVFSYVTLGYVLGQTNDDRSYRALSLFSEVLQRVQQDYVEEPSIPQVTSGALHGLLESLDPQSSYLTAREYAEYKKKPQEGRRGETGLTLSRRFGYLVVVSALPDSPAHKAGMRNGDILEAIAGFSTREMSIGQGYGLLAGEPATGVKVSVVSRRFGTGGQAQDVDIVRRELAYPAVLADKLEGEIGYLRLPALNAGKAEEVRQKLAQFERQGLRKLVVDLRDCAVGDANEAIETARLLVPSGTLATLRGQTVAAKTFAAEPAKLAWKHPVSVLISNGTSGAAEVLAAALAGNPGATGAKVEVVGERTFGTASEQKLIPLEDGAALVLTVANYYTPAGKSIPDEGVQPTVDVRDSDSSDADESGASDARPGPADDPILKKAIELLLSPRAAEKKGARLLRRSSAEAPA